MLVRVGFHRQALIFSQSYSFSVTCPIFLVHTHTTPGGRSVPLNVFGSIWSFFSPNYGLDEPKGPSFAAAVESNLPQSSVPMCTLTKLLQLLMPPMQKFVYKGDILCSLSGSLFYFGLPLK